jgi:hypothetical protein
MRSLRTDVLFCGKDYFMRVTKFGSDQHGNNIQRQKALRALGRPFINTEAKTFLRGLPSSQMTRTTDVPTEALSKMRWCLLCKRSGATAFSFARSHSQKKITTQGACHLEHQQENRRSRHRESNKVISALSTVDISNFKPKPQVPSVQLYVSSAPPSTFVSFIAFPIAIFDPKSRIRVFSRLFFPIIAG